MKGDRSHLWSKTKIDPHDTLALKQAIETARKVEFWGCTYEITPRLVDDVLGNGRQLIYFEPTNTRPNYYVVRIDSKWSLSNWDQDRRKLIPGDWVEDVLQAIELQFGNVDDTWEDENGVEHQEEGGFPVLSIGSGYTWGEYVWPKRILATPVKEMGT